MESVKPCPFCGSKVKCETLIHTDLTIRYMAACKNPFCFVKPFLLGDNEDEVMTIWNKRSVEKS